MDRDGWPRTGIQIAGVDIDSARDRQLRRRALWLAGFGVALGAALALSAPWWGALTVAVVLLGLASVLELRRERRIHRAATAATVAELVALTDYLLRRDQLIVVRCEPGDPAHGIDVAAVAAVPEARLEIGVLVAVTIPASPHARAQAGQRRVALLDTRRLVRWAAGLPLSLSAYRRAGP